MTSRSDARCKKGLVCNALLGFAAAAMLSVSLAGSAFGQIPEAVKKAAGKGDAAATAPAAFDPKSMRAHVEKQLDELRGRAERERSAGSPEAPVGLGAEEQDAARKALATLPFIYESQLQTLERIAEQSKRRAEAESAERSWSGFKEAQPFSILLSDNVHEQSDIHKAALDELRASQKVLRVEQQRFQDRAQAANEAVRRAQEALEQTSPGTQAHTLALFRLQATRDSARLPAALVSSTMLLLQEQDERIGVIQAEVRLDQAKIAALAGKTVFSKSDLEEALKRLTQVRTEREKELQALLAQSTHAGRERDDARKALDAARGTSTQSADLLEPVQALRLAEARFRAAENRFASLREQTQSLTVLVTLYHDMIVQAWGQRFTVHSGTDPGERQEARKGLDGIVEYLKAWNARTRAQQNELRTALRAQEELEQSASDGMIARYERDALQSIRQLDMALERNQAMVERRLRRLAHWQQEFADALKARSVPEISAELWVRLKDVGGQIWEYELLTIEDTIEIEGKPVTTTRGLTVGKSIGAILFFLLSLRILTLASGRAQRIFIKRFHVGEEQGKTIRRWLNVFGGLMLLMLTLNLVRIPLTVFAFAGGALAIGIGFGTQTLIKNLISGMIVLIERHVRVGDIVEVEGVTGTITAVDIRSSTVRGFDGVETTIPNSMLLEQKVTNWTLTSANLRRTIKVGVAYGSPVREVERILAECAQQHARVLKDPAPLVVFEDFGDNALVFTLYVWVRIGAGGNLLQVMSDLRFWIEKAMNEAGISIAFPQRDVHLDTTRPLKIEVVRPGTTTSDPSADSVANSPIRTAASGA